MAKGQFLSDTFEQLAEIGQSTAKKTVKSVAQTFNPLAIFDTAPTKESQAGDEKKAAEFFKSKNSTPLDVNQLQEKYKNQDQVKADALRNRLFQMVKSGEEKNLQEKKQKQKQKKYQEIQEAESQRRQLEQKRIQEQQAIAPQGKERKSILGGKKKKGVNPQPAEIKPSTGKQ
jgi:hypothetical protein